MIRSMKIAAALLLALMTAAAVCGCGTVTDTENDDLGTGTYTGSGYEYRAVTEDGRANIRYLDAILDIEEAEFVVDDFDDQTYLVLHMDFTNDSTIYRADGDEDTDFYLDRLR